MALCMRPRAHFKGARWLLLLGLLTTGGALKADAQHESSSRGDDDTPVEPNASYDGRFTFVRIRHRALLDERPEQCYGSSDGPGWRHDYPRAERNLLQILGQVTSLEGRGDSSLVLYADDPTLFKYPLAYVAESGCWNVSDKEVQGLRQYLLKGGLLIVDDLTFGGGLSLDMYQLAQHTFEEYIHRVLPESKLITVDSKSPIFHAFFTLEAGMMPAAGNAPKPEFRAIFEDNDPTRRPMVLATYNTSIGHYWRWASQGFYAVESTNEAYKVGVNYVLYGLTH